MSTTREDIAAKCRALAAKTVENGCTEAEALAAAELLTKLLQKHNMTMGEAELKATSFDHSKQRVADEVGVRLWKVASAIGKLTGCTYWQSAVGVNPVEYNFFGFEHEVMVARYLLAICCRAMRTEEARVNRSNALYVESKRRRLLLPFLDGMRDRLAERLLEMIPPTPTGTGLVVLRNALILKGLKDIGINLQPQRAGQSRDFEPSYFDGRAAADRVGLNRGLESARPLDQARLG